MLRLTLPQARWFILLKHGLTGDYKFVGKQGALDFIRQAGCIQFDPVDVCGKNAELTLQSRVKGFSKQTLYELLYQDRMLADYPDKNLSIIPTESWPYFERYRQAARDGGRRFEGLSALEEQARAYITSHGPVSSDELPIAGSTRWHSSIHWSGNWSGESNAARSALEQLYSTGELMIHHKTGARKYYDLTSRYLPAELLNAPDPIPGDAEHLKWRVLRRIGAVGLMWNRPSDGWLNIWGLKAEQRNAAFAALMDEGKLLAMDAEGFKAPLYCRAEDGPLLEAAVRMEALKPRCELLAPLDCMLWDRKLILALFGFDYKWEIYTPADKRKYGFYVLPLIYGDGFGGRVEAVADKKAGVLTVKHIWYEDGVKATKKLLAAVEKCLMRFAAFNECENIVYPEA